MLITVICPGLKDYFFSKVKDDKVRVVEEPFVSETNRLKKLLQRVIKKTDVGSLYYIFLKKSLSRLLSNSSKCIIFDQAFSPALVKAVHKMNKKARIIVYLWNPVFKDRRIIPKLEQVKRYVSIYSFDKNDCKTYGFQFSPMIYDFSSIMDYQKEDNCKPQYDVSFVGYLKNREDNLVLLYNYLTQNGLAAFYYVLDNIKSGKTFPFPIYEKYLDYDEYKKIIKSSKAILDIVQNGQTGLTIRSMETLAFQKKLITNNTDVKNYSFYKPANIFVLGEDDIDSLMEFLNSDFEPVSSDIMREYNFTDWARSLEALDVDK